MAHWGGSRVSRYAPDGSVERIVPMPVPNVTSVTFAGAELTTLYITTAREGMTPRAARGRAGGGRALPAGDGDRGPARAGNARLTCIGRHGGGMSNAMKRTIRHARPAVGERRPCPHRAPVSSRLPSRSADLERPVKPHHREVARGQYLLDVAHVAVAAIRIGEDLRNWAQRSSKLRSGAAAVGGEEIRRRTDRTPPSHSLALNASVQRVRRRARPLPTSSAWAGPSASRSGTIEKCEDGWPSERGAHAAVDQQHLAGDVAAVVRAQEEGGSGDVVGLAGAAQQDAAILQVDVLEPVGLVLVAPPSGRSAMRVSMKPGAIALTLMPRLPTSAASARVKLAMPPLAVE